jgi:hypothetical protein
MLKNELEEVGVPRRAISPNEGLPIPYTSLGE